MKYFALCFLLLCAFAGSAWADTPTIERRIAVLRAIDKVTGRVAEFQVEKGELTKFGAIFITVKSCRVTSPDQAPESAAFLDVSEFKREQQQQVTVFSGWMFASSPALSAMDHPVYDLWLIGCRQKVDPKKKSES